jgi:hypothetical protein
MPQHHTDPGDVAKLRDRLMEGLAALPTFAEAIGKSKRAVRRMGKLGQIDIVKFGGTAYVRLESVRKAA